VISSRFSAVFKASVLSTGLFESFRSWLLVMGLSGRFLLPTRLRWDSLWEKRNAVGPVNKDKSPVSKPDQFLCN
jgi:hypothetical protein